MPADVAAQESAAVLIHSIGEVLTGHAHTGSLPALKLLLVDEVPFLHAPKSNSTIILCRCFGVVARVARSGRELVETQQFESHG